MSGAEAPPQRRTRLIVALLRVLAGGERLTSAQLLSRFKNDLAYSGSTPCTPQHLGDLARRCTADLTRSLIYTGKIGNETIWMRVVGVKGKEYLDSCEPPNVVSTGMDAKPDSKRRCSSPLSPQQMDFGSMLYLLIRPKYPPERRPVAINGGAPAYRPDVDVGHTGYMAFQTEVKKFLLLNFLCVSDLKSVRCVSKRVSPPLDLLRFHPGIRVTKFESKRVPIGADSAALAAVRAAFVAFAEVHGGCSASLQRDLSSMQSGLARVLRANKVCGCMARGKRSGGRGSSACRCAEAGGWGSSLVDEKVDEEEMEEAEEESEHRMVCLASAASRQPCSSAAGGDGGVRERPPLFSSSSSSAASSSAAASSTLVATPTPVRAVRRLDLSTKFTSPRHFPSTKISTLSLPALQNEVRTLRRDLQLARADLQRLSLPLLHPSTLSPETTAFEVLMMQHNLKNKRMLVRSTVVTSAEERRKLRSRITDVSLEFLSQAPSNRSFTKLRDIFKLPLNCLRLLQKKIKDLEIGIAVILELPIRVLFIQMVLDLVSGEAFMARAGLVFAVEGDELDSSLLELWDALGEYVNESPQLAKVLREMESVPTPSVALSSVPPLSAAGGGGGAAEEEGGGGGAVAAEWGVEEDDDLATAKMLLDLSAAPPTERPPEDCGEASALDSEVRVPPPKIELKNGSISIAISTKTPILTLTLTHNF